MKKILLLAATTALITSGAAFAESNEGLTSTNNESNFESFNANNFYIKLSGGASLNKLYTSDEDSKKNLPKAKIAPLAAVALGYSITDNLRAELEGAYVFNPKFKYSREKNKVKNGISHNSKTSLTIEPTIWTGMASLYYDIVQVQNFKVFAGVGAGASYTKSKVSETQEKKINGVLNQNKSGTDTGKSKGKISIAGHLTAGVSAEISEGITGELAYRFQYNGKPNFNPEKVKNKDLAWHLYSHNIVAGIRFTF